LLWPHDTRAIREVARGPTAHRRGPRHLVETKVYTVCRIHIQRAARSETHIQL